MALRDTEGRTGGMTNSVADFWAKVTIGEPEECWPYQPLSRDGKGYGMTRLGGRQYRAHRLAYLLSVGPIPAGLFVCHRCDNPPCCNPAHLFVGTVADNNRDRVLKGRGRAAAGDEHGQRRHPNRRETMPGTRLSWAKADYIRAAYANGETPTELALRLGVSREAVSHVVHGRTWVRPTEREAV
jgi:hypothetical protein